ncbi:hypothetical protein [Aeromonas allosaccharophila]|uniref:hypothetical protein n=1 Tax=Aeromonas allosaccharophila TaxID=656 RepID=UPI003D1BA038
MLELWSLRWVVVVGAIRNWKGFAQECRGSMLIGDLVAAVEPAGEKIKKGVEED